MGSKSTTIQAPAAPNYQESMRDILTAQVEMAPKLYAAEAKYQPLYNQLQTDQQKFLAQQQLDMARTAYPQIAQLEADYTQANRQAELSQLRTALPAYQQAFETLTPGYSRAIASMGQIAQNAAASAAQAPTLTDFVSGIRGPQVGNFVDSIAAFDATTPLSVLKQTAAQAAAQAGKVPDAVNLQGVQSAFDAAKAAGAVPEAVNLRDIVGPQLQAGLDKLNRGTVDQYLATMPGMTDYAQKLSQISQQELAAGRGLTTEEQRLADQAVRSAYAARGTALGPQAVNAEILNRADVQNQRFQQRLANAQVAANQIQGIYQPALQQSYERQLSGLQYGLTAQQQAFGQAQNRDAMQQALQAQRYSQAMGTQSTGFNQAQAKDTIASALQAQRYSQLMNTQGTGFNQLLNEQNLLQGAQQQAYQQAMDREQLGLSAQTASFQQALAKQQAEQQRLQTATSLQAGQAQLAAGALGQLQAAQTPVLQAFYKQPILQGQQGQSQQMALAMQQQSGPQLFNPESATGMGSIYGAYNAQMNLAGAQAQANAATQAAKYGMIGNIVGAAGTLGAGIAKCWVAREVYGEHNPTWKIFREWLIEDAPKWFHDLYCKYGERFAKFISNKPKLKRLVKAWMDSKIS